LQVKEQTADESFKRVMEQWDRVVEAAKDMIAKLRVAGVVSIIAAYDGAGGYGEVETIEFTFGDGESATAIDDLNCRLAATGVTGDAAVKVIKDLVYEFLVHEHPLWDINDGGYGELVVDARTGMGICMHNERHMESEYYEAEFEI
jgi:hypothetical protein